MAFRQPEEADACIAAVHQRWFDGRTLEAESWDGRTKYTIKESQEEMEKRLNKWHSFIEGDTAKVEGGKSEGQSQSGTKTASNNEADDNSTSKPVVTNEDSVVPDVNKSLDDANTV